MAPVRVGDTVTLAERPGALVAVVSEVFTRDATVMIVFADPDDGAEHTMPAAEFTRWAG